MAMDLSMPVLVVDDYNTMIRIIRNLLKQLGFENIDDASDGSAALNKMRGKKYGLVISDWNMEPMTGYDLLKEVRSDPNLATTPFIMITAESKTENVIAAKKAGVNNYIVKPFNAATLSANDKLFVLQPAAGPTVISAACAAGDSAIAAPTMIIGNAARASAGRVCIGCDHEGVKERHAGAECVRVPAPCVRRR